jgi:predicted transcriptional regulator
MERAQKAKKRSFASRQERDSGIQRKRNIAPRSFHAVPEPEKALSSKILLISIRPQWVCKILAGRKTIELRRRPPRLSQPVPALIYETSPVCRLRATCLMGPVSSHPPDTLWGQVGHRSCVSMQEYDAYFAGQKQAHGIEISCVREMPSRLTLEWLRRQADFVPPQSWAWAPERLLEALEAVRC